MCKERKEMKSEIQEYWMEALYKAKACYYTVVRYSTPYGPIEKPLLRPANLIPSYSQVNRDLKLHSLSKTSSYML